MMKMGWMNIFISLDLFSSFFELNTNLILLQTFLLLCDKCVAVDVIEEHDDCEDGDVVEEHVDVDYAHQPAH